MTNSSISVLKQHIASLLKVLEPVLSFANCHMVDFFTNSCFRNFIPVNIQGEIESIGLSSFTEYLFQNDLSNTPYLQDFIQNCEKFTLGNCTNICLNLDDFLKKLQNWGDCDIEKFKLEVFMTAKKSHEVEILSAIAATVSSLTKTSYIVDIGDGKGYLSSMLALHDKISVLGVDASSINTCGANKRAHKLSKIWNNIPNAPHKSYPKKNDNANRADIDLYKQVTAFVDENFDLQKLVSDSFGSTSVPLRLGLVGLHTCGDLSANSLKIFDANDCVKFICNVGCCYHLLTERFEKNADCCFPMSTFLTEKKTKIGRSARMIANQSVDRIWKAKELPNVTIFYRALLQVLLERHCIDLPAKHVGKFRKKPESFLNYARIALKRLDVDVEISDQQIHRIHSIYENRLNELNVFYLLRCRLAPVIESLVLLDRLLFMKEKGFENSFLVQFFDPIVSPRCYGIVAFKEIVE